MTTTGAERAATIMDVAREAGVSRAAVSKVLRDAYGVSPAMRQRVGEAIERLEYRPRIAARAMRGATYTLGVEIPSFGNPFFSRILAGVSRALADTEYQLILATAEAAGKGYRAIEALADRQVDGVIAISPLASTSWLERVATQMPLVMFARHDSSARYDTIVGDDYTGARLAMSHLLDLGHRNIAHLTLTELTTVFGAGTPHAIRMEVYLEAMGAAGCSEHAQIVRSDADTATAAHAAVAALIASPDRPSAIFAAHDELAIGALQAVAEAGLNISVMGYDNIQIAAYPQLSLSTIDQTGDRMGARAAELLLERIAGRTEAVHEIQPVELLRRNSTRSPAD